LASDPESQPNIVGYLDLSNFSGSIETLWDISDDATSDLAFKGIKVGEEINFSFDTPYDFFARGFLPVYTRHTNDPNLFFYSDDINSPSVNKFINDVNQKYVNAGFSNSYKLYHVAS
jgi:hypothetical protein